jgi:adenylate cyclase
MSSGDRAEEPGEDGLPEVDACLVCGTRLVGLTGIIVGLTGIHRSHRNPNVCTRCNMHIEDGSITEVTILFADLCGFTSMTHDLGPERTHAIVDTVMGEATQIVVAQDGVVDKHIGDAVMALFNVPVERSDHAARGVAAARELIAAMGGLGERLKHPLELRAGVATGAVRIGALGSKDVRDFTVIGDAANRAARLQAQAEPGEIVIDAGAYTQVADAYPGLPPELLSLKGFPEPVLGFRIVDPDTGPSTRPASTGVRVRSSLGLGSLLVSLLGAPCVIGAAVNPAATILALGAAAGTTALTPSHGIDSPWVRIPLLALAVLAVAANLYIVGRARRARRRAATSTTELALSPRERRRERLVLGLSYGALAMVILEQLAHHFVMHHTFF